MSSSVYVWVFTSDKTVNLCQSDVVMVDVTVFEQAP